MQAGFTPHKDGKEVWRESDRKEMIWFYDM